MPQRRPTPTDEAADRVVADAMDQVRLADQQARDALARLHRLDNDLRRVIVNAGLSDVNRTLYRSGRAGKAVQAAAKEYARAYRQLGTALKRYLRGVAGVAQEQTVASLNAALGGDVVRKVLASKKLSALADAAAVQGARVDAWVRKLASDARHRFDLALRQAVVQRMTEEQVLKAVIGSRRFLRRDARGREYWEYGGGVNDVARNQLDTLVRTATAEVAADAHAKVLDAQGALLRGVQAIAVLDDRTTPTCRARHGAAWDLRGEPLPDSPVKLKFPGPPPWHWNCRTTLAPVFRSLDEVRGLDAALADAIPGDVRKAMTGGLPVDFTFDDWFKRRSAAEQRDILGPARYELWRDNSLTSQDMVDRRGYGLTVKQLRNKVRRRR